MAIRTILTEGDPKLTKVCHPVTKFDQKLADLLDDMVETLEASGGVGLAAPQIGILRRAVVVDTGEEFLELVNPASRTASRAACPSPACTGLSSGPMS